MPGDGPDTENPNGVTKRRAILAGVFSMGAMIAGTVPSGVAPELFVLLAAGWFGLAESLDRTIGSESDCNV